MYMCTHAAYDNFMHTKHNFTLPWYHFYFLLTNLTMTRGFKKKISLPYSMFSVSIVLSSTHVSLLFLSLSLSLSVYDDVLYSFFLPCTFRTFQNNCSRTLSNQSFCSLILQIRGTGNADTFIFILSPRFSSVRCFPSNDAHAVDLESPGTTIFSVTLSGNIIERNDSV